MARYIDADELIKKIFPYDVADKKRYAINAEAVYKAIQNATTADVVEVCRCKDCEWYQESKIFPPNKFCFRLKHPVEDRQIGYNFSPDDFCSYGKRKEK